ncbi:hypothetical protein JI735_34305 (plasmid) [Paenibacillus sonchi]|uniref:Uncharacterized protein n=1 Tax=Paenibacillus sonchi TaxID=373687 RepID=A0A974SFE0_9BACL|nr:hypothetical protein [Paenibacillus sonchi]QQZ64513.1 hypothetical protein JI735_34305 [Paenibacillus sonchi]
MTVTNQDIFNLLKQENDIFKELQTKSKTFSDSIRNTSYISFIIMAFLSVISILPVVFISNPENKWVKYLVIGQFVLTFLFLRIAYFAQVYFARKKYSHFVCLLDTESIFSRVIFSTNLAPMREAYLSKELLPTILSLPASQRKTLINVYLKKGEKIKNSNWYIITLLGVMLFAVWTGFIGAVIEHEESFNGMIALLFIFLIISMVLTVFVSVYKHNLERAFLKKTFDYMLLADIITRIDALAAADNQTDPLPPTP